MLINQFMYLFCCLCLIVYLFCQHMLAINMTVVCGVYCNILISSAYVFPFVFNFYKSGPNYPPFACCCLRSVCNCILMFYLLTLVCLQIPNHILAYHEEIKQSLHTHYGLKSKVAQITRLDGTYISAR